MAGKKGGGRKGLPKKGIGKRGAKKGGTADTTSKTPRIPTPKSKLIVKLRPSTVYWSEITKTPPASPASPVEDDLTDVYYYDNGRRRRILEHEQSLDLNAAVHAKKLGYEDQADIANGRIIKRPKPSIKRVRIVVDVQDFWTLYAKDYPPGWSERNPIHDDDIYPVKSLKSEVVIPPRDEQGIDKLTFMRCSSLAEEFFTFEPDKNELHLPVLYPRSNLHPRWDFQMAYIDPAPIKESIIPWMAAVKEWFDKATSDPDTSTIPKPEIPDTLAKKIHLYNAMLQLGVPKFIQKDLVEVLCKDIYQRKLEQCELDLLEVTIGRFHSSTVPFLDPVLNHLVGTYGFRDKEGDRDIVNRPGPQSKPRHLEYGVRNAGRTEYRKDTVMLAPRLPVLGHCIKNWSGVRYRDGDARFAHTGYPLNVGKVLKHWRRNPEDPILGKRKRTPPRPENTPGENTESIGNEAVELDEEDTIGHTPKSRKQRTYLPLQKPPKEGIDYGREGYHYTEYSTYLLNKFQEYYENKPGVMWRNPDGTVITKNARGQDWGKSKPQGTAGTGPHDEDIGPDGAGFA